jgi:hypothetical protein
MCPLGTERRLTFLKGKTLKNATPKQLDGYSEDFSWGVSQDAGLEPQQNQVRETPFCKNLRIGVRMLKSGGCLGPQNYND